MESKGASSPGILSLTTSLSKPFTRLERYPALLKELDRHMEVSTQTFSKQTCQTKQDAWVHGIPFVPFLGGLTSGPAPRQSRPARLHERLQEPRRKTQQQLSACACGGEPSLRRPLLFFQAQCQDVRKKKDLELQILTEPIRNWEGDDIKTLGPVLHMSQAAVNAQNCQVRNPDAGKNARLLAESQHIELMTYNKITSYFLLFLRSSPSATSSSSLTLCSCCLPAPG